MTAVPYNISEITNQCRAHVDAREGGATQSNFVLLKGGGFDNKYCVKMGGWLGGAALRIELEMMNHLKACNTSKKLAFPTGYMVLEDDCWSYLVMEYLPGLTMWEVMENGLLPLATKDADDIAEVLEALHANRKLVSCLPDMNTLTPTGPWLPQAHFFRDGFGGHQLENTTEFQAFMTKRLLLAKCDPTEIDLTDKRYIHGDLHPHNIKRLPDGRIGMIDFGRSFFGPGWWDVSVIRTANEHQNWTEPLLTSLSARGIRTTPAHDFIIRKFWFWFGRFGWAVTRQVEVTCGHRIHRLILNTRDEARLQRKLEQEQVLLQEVV